MYKYEDHKWLEPGHYIWMKKKDARQYLTNPKDKEYFQVEFYRLLTRTLVPTANFMPNFVNIPPNTPVDTLPNADLALVLKPNVANHLYQLEIGVDVPVRTYVMIEGDFIWVSDQETVTASNPDIGYIDEQISPFDDPSPESQFFLVYDVPFQLRGYHNVAGVSFTPRYKVRGRRLLISHISENKYPELYDKLEKKIIPSRAVFCKEKF